jgi:tetratricopeptide (TPR) repeat protein
MSKNITIQEGGTAKQFTAQKLQTSLVGGGTQLWVPEDEAGDYAKATEFYAQAGECFAANTDEYRRCASRIKEIRGVRFDAHISKGEVLMEQGELDQACREFEDAKEYAEGIGEFNEERQAVYEARISAIEMKRLQQAAAQSQHAASTFAEHIAKASSIKMLIDRTKKWHKD